MSLLSALQQLLASGFSEDLGIFPEPYDDLPSFDPEVSPSFDLPSVLVPPEVIEIENLDLGSSIFQDGKAENKREEMPQYYLSLFDNEVSRPLSALSDLTFPVQVTPDPTTPAGYSIRSTLADVVDIFEVNRKDCARILLEIPRWFKPGTFKPKPGMGSQNSTEQSQTEKGWQLESSIIEVSSL